ncbi:OLC1v1037628C4 [Oldenlandia corymbosa var. corymbosa]|uniref:OLC1v1037628C4 n=2 Tax=Oldenlandia corymbosa var. corymbosa TaxID=529605 RepID=A0AAV1CZ12_OLDCO|nr:OLC1v1037628C4 [Oldenlandia corymbosa var. corymbosa]
MFVLNPSPPFFQVTIRTPQLCYQQFHHYPPFLNVVNSIPPQFDKRVSEFTTKATQKHQFKMPNFEHLDEEEYDSDEEDDEEDAGEFSGRRGFKGEEDGKDYDKDPEFADILGSVVDNPEKARTKMEERLRKKRNRILHTKTGSATPMKVTFKKFEFSNSYIWFEFYHAPLEKDVALICDTIRSWHIVGRLGGCNSMNMQLSQSPLDKRPSYDAVQGANVSPTTFYNIGDLEVQDNLARIWVDIGTSEPMLLDVLINALTQISSETNLTY